MVESSGVNTEPPLAGHSPNPVTRQTWRMKETNDEEASLSATPIHATEALTKIATDTEEGGNSNESHT